MDKRDVFKSVVDEMDDDLDGEIIWLNPVPPPSRRLIVKRGGHSITRQIPKPVVFVDTRERDPLDLSSFPNWIGGERRQKLGAGDYSVERMEGMLALERKTLPDIVATVMQHRVRFFRMCEKLPRCRWKALLIEARTLFHLFSTGANCNIKDVSVLVFALVHGIFFRYSSASIIPAAFFCDR